ncbi:MAG: alginate export family protein [Phycisphaerae bacterium]
MRSATPRYPLILGAAMCLIVCSGPAVAQLSLDAGSSRGVSSAFLERQRALERENERRLREALPPSQKIRIDYGGWFNSYFFLFDDGFESSRTLRQNELRLWASLSADEGVHEAYARMRASYFDWNAGDAFTRNEDDLDGPNLERGWYQFDIAQALRVHGGVEKPFELKLKMGRDLVYAGTGYAIDLTLDHVSLQGEVAGFETTFLAGKTPASTENIDRSRPVADHSDRVFLILEERYKGWDEHEPFVYIAWQDDHTTEDPPNLFQQYRYDSRYIGFGSTGELVDNLRYSSEWVFERGRSYNHQRFINRSDIKSWGFDHRLDYYFRHKTKPVLSAEWMFASGDANRLGSPTNAAGGNRRDHVDRGFVGFGFRDTGIAFSPRLSNIHVWRLGGSFRPLPEVEAAKDLELGTDWFLFQKHRSNAAVSDGLANRQSGYLGWEMDYFANYRIFNDLAWTVRFGAFFPGKAFTDRTTRTFLLTGVTWSF